jgi:hypothetical protein
MDANLRFGNSYDSLSNPYASWLDYSPKGDFLRLLSSLIDYLSDGLVLDKSFWKKFLSKSSQAAKKQPVERKKSMDVAICI